MRKLYIVLELQEDSEGMICPCFFDYLEMLEQYPSSDYLSVDIIVENLN